MSQSPQIGSSVQRNNEYYCRWSGGVWSQSPQIGSSVQRLKPSPVSKSSVSKSQSPQIGSSVQSEPIEFIRSNRMGFVAIPSNRVKRSKPSHGRAGPGAAIVAIPSNRVKRSKARNYRITSEGEIQSQSPQIGSSVQSMNEKKIRTTLRNVAIPSNRVKRSKRLALGIALGAEEVAIPSNRVKRSKGGRSLKRSSPISCRNPLKSGQAFKV